MAERRRSHMPLILAVGLAIWWYGLSGYVPAIGLPTVITVAPIKSDALAMLIVEETADRQNMTAAQLSILTSTAIREYIASKGGSLRILDDDVELANELPMWRDAMARERASLPWLIVSNGRTGVEQPLPANEAETLAILKRFGGG